MACLDGLCLSYHRNDEFYGLLGWGDAYQANKTRAVNEPPTSVESNPAGGRPAAIGAVVNAK
jgi:hypothetical protein